MENEITSRLEHDKIGRLLLHYTLPAIIGTMVNALYNIIDRIFIGQEVGALAISGLTLTFPILIFLQGFGMLVGAGAAARVSIYLGGKEHHVAEQVLGNALTLTFLLSVLSIIPSLIWLDEILIWFGGSEQTLPYAKDYLYITIPGNFLATISFGFNAVMRAAGYPKKAMLYMLLGAVLNIILDALFILVLEMGIRGAAIATVISMAVTSLLVVNHFLRPDTLIRFRRKYLRLSYPVVMSIVTIGLSPFSMQMAGSFVNVALNSSLKKYGGDLAIGANGIIASFGLLLVMLVMGLAQGMQPIVGFNYGAGRYDRSLKALRISVNVATVIVTVGFLASFFFPEWIVRAFTNDELLIAISTNGLKISFLLFAVVGSEIVISQYFQSIGQAWKSIFLSLSRQCIFLVPAIYILPVFFDLDGVWLAASFSDLIAAVFAWVFIWQHVKTSKRVLECW